MSEGKSKRPSEDGIFLHREIIDAIKRSEEKIETYSRTIEKKNNSEKKKILSENR